MRTALLFVRPSAASSEVSDRFDLEAEAAEELGLPCFSLPLEDVVDGRLSELPRGRFAFVYRGWMLTEDEYTGLDEALRAAGHRLFTSPDAYAATHYLPAWYPRLRPYTARTVWTEDASAARAWDAAQEELGPPPYLLKDHVKSAKADWSGACFVARGTPRERFIEMAERLVELRGDRFERGIVVRRYLDFVVVEQTDTGPLHCEFRLFFVRGRLVAAAPYHDVELETPDFGAFEGLLRHVPSPFFTADVAQLTGGGWAVVELGDGGVSTFPAQLDPRDVHSHWRRP